MNKRILNKAISISRSMDNNGQNICAIIVDKKNKILSIGLNQYNKSHPLQKEYAKKYDNENKIYLHAELASLIGLPYGKVPYAIYIARTGANGEPRICKPCKICTKAIQDYKIEKIYYTKGQT